MADNDTDGARLIEGDDGGALGREERWKPEYGDVLYDDSEKKRGGMTASDRLEEGREYNSHEKLRSDKGKATAKSIQYGLPKFIKGDPLGCGCSIAHLAGVTKPVGSHIEADYMCDVGYHNFVVFELIGFENKGESIIKVDANGNLIDDSKVQAAELQEF